MNVYIYEVVWVIFTQYVIYSVHTITRHTQKLSVTNPGCKDCVVFLLFVNVVYE